MGKKQMRLVLLFLGFISSGFCLQCYKCFDTTKTCNYGKKEDLGVLNCSSPNEVCATFQYETDDSVRVYTTTIRGCQPLVQEGICNQLMKTVQSKIIKNSVQKGTFCETCNTDLCNSSKDVHIQIIMFMLPFISYLLM